MDDMWKMGHNSERREPTAKPLALEESSIDNMYVREKRRIGNTEFLYLSKLKKG